MPWYAAWILAAQELGCSVFDLLARRDAWHWREMALLTRRAVLRAENERAVLAKSQAGKPLGSGG